mmetsp:Transcript_5781/g.11807  ORF Transcript_5781/g.11807 Transcript_5781/m.11807 type:complete len:209 (-) Transcript_5781:1242-1868(-)
MLTCCHCRCMYKSPASKRENPVAEFRDERHAPAPPGGRMEASMARLRSSRNCSSPSPMLASLGSDFGATALAAPAEGPGPAAMPVAPAASAASGGNCSTSPVVKAMWYNSCTLGGLPFVPCSCSPDYAHILGGHMWSLIKDFDDWPIAHVGRVRAGVDVNRVQVTPEPPRNGFADAPRVQTFLQDSLGVGFGNIQAMERAILIRELFE